MKAKSFAGAWTLMALSLLASLAGAEDLVFENDDFRLTVGTNAVVKSLTVKSTREECVDASLRLPLMTVTQDRPFNNEIKLIHPNKRTVYPACSLRREGNRLLVGFSHRQYEAVIGVKTAPKYLAFTLEDFRCDRKTTYDYLRMDIPPVASLRVMELPVRNRANFGDWLNANWDERAAVAVVGTSPYPDIDHEDRAGARILFGEVFAGRKLRGAGAALVAAPGREAFLDAMDAIEVDFGLPRGVKSRRSPETSEFIFHLANDFTPTNVEETLRYVQAGGFRLVTFVQRGVTQEIGSWGTCGDYDLRTDYYPNGLDDLRKLLGRFHAAGVKVGLHTFHPHIGLRSRYVTPVADPRLNKTRRFTLAEALPEGTNDLAEITVCEPTADTVMFEPCRILQFGGELLSYERYTETPPYKFLGVRRGAWATRPTAHPKGEIGGILDVSEFGTPCSCYLDQQTDLQDEIAEKIARLYNCGFDYIYLDGSEGVNRPFNFHVANGQYRVWKHLRPEPIFGEGAAKTHFGWHMLGGANAFDCFPSEVFKEKLREFPFRQAPVTWQDMSRVDFGWWCFFPPDPAAGKSIGTQADAWEYGASVATAWRCAASIQMPLEVMRAHPRLWDILEVMRRWSDIRRRALLTEAWREELKRDYLQEHHLLLLPDGTYELVRCDLLTDGQSDPGPESVRAFVFVRGGFTYVTYWHTRSEGSFVLPLKASDVTVADTFDGSPLGLTSVAGGLCLPAGNRRYLKTALPREAVIRAWKAAARP